MKILIYIALLFPFSLFAQSADREVIAASGDNSSATGIIATWTIGEPLIGMGTTSNLIITEGFNQSDVISVGLAELPFNGLVKVFPNPTVSSFTLSIASNESVYITVRIYDVLGNEILVEVLGSIMGERSTVFSLEGYHPGYYFLRVVDDKGNNIKTVKIQKI